MRKVLRLAGFATMAGFLLSFVIAPTAARATEPRTVIDVYPGAHAIGNALAQAQAGDTLRVHTGTYKEHVAIKTPSLTIEVAKDGPVTIDGGCRFANTVLVKADGLRLDGRGEGGLTIQGGSVSEVTFLDVPSGSAHYVSVVESCRGQAEFGFLVEGVHHVSIVNGSAQSYFDNAGIYVDNIRQPDSFVLIAYNTVFGTNRGIEVSGVANAIVEVRHNTVYNSFGSGIRIVASDGVRINRNRVTVNGDAGIDLLDDVTNALVQHNVARGNRPDMRNLGTNNCFRYNHFDTHQGDIGC
jgi:parallel beta-helix repeat protein